MVQEVRVLGGESQNPHPVSQIARDKDGAPSDSGLIKGNLARKVSPADGPSGPAQLDSSKAGFKKEDSDFPFAVALANVYEGPLDLLLDLVRKQDIDIYDIPIAKITAQYLAYVERLRELDVN